MTKDARPESRKMVPRIGNNKMKTLLVFGLLPVAPFASTLPICAENACSGVDRTLSKERAKALSPTVAKQPDARHAEISQSLRFGGWSILYVATGEADMRMSFSRVIRCGANI